MNSNLPPVEVAALEKGIDLQHLPAHVAIIMDGNGRWAKQRLLNRINGHERGAETVRTIVTASREIGISTLYRMHFSRPLRPHNPGMVLNLALSYGARAEIVRMTRILAEKAIAGSLDPQSITEETVSAHLYTHNLPDPDLLIRTSGEMRISNFLLWQIAYSELHITKTLWPDFSRNEYLDILKDYQQRNRRFGNA